LQSGATVQVGEPVAVVPVAEPPPDSEFAGEVLSVTFKSGIKVSYLRKPIAGPHWEKGSEGAIVDLWSRLAKVLNLPLVPYSKRAVVYLAAGLDGSYDVEVKLKITKSKNVGGEARLTGTLCGTSIEGTCPSSLGEHTVSARITNPPDELRACRGRITWRLDVDATPIGANLGSTFAEIYFILGRPGFRYRMGVWVEVLRLLFGRVGVAGNDPNAVIAAITAYCHGGHGLKYETDKGAAQFGVGHRGGVFSLGSYLDKLPDRCNCYDQAAAVQSFASAVGVASVWQFLKPFGFIRPTDLVGVGLCNNPFFGKNESLKLVAPDSDRRTGFGNHAFAVTLDWKTVDACAKPHLATETVPEYLSDSIDDTPSLYRYYRSFRPGQPTDVRPKLGVVAVE
jgi:hypothetical protein